MCCAESLGGDVSIYCWHCLWCVFACGRVASSVVSVTGYIQLFITFKCMI